MYKEAINFITAALVAIAIPACSNGKSEEQIKAEELYGLAQSKYDSSNYEEAILYIDSLVKTYPGVIDVQRNAMHLKTLIVEKKTIADSIANDSIILANKAVVDSLAKQFQFVKTKDMVEGYSVLNSIGADRLVKATGIEPRINEAGDIYLLSSLYGNAVGHTSLRVSGTSGQVETGVVPQDNANNYRFRDGSTQVEMVTFSKEKCDTFCQFIAANRNDKLTVSFCGRKSTQVVLTDRTKSEIATTYDYATKKSELKHAEDMRLYYSKKLQITRRQIRATATNITGDKKE
ncbi:MAG: hypothetical protein KIG59_04040 [Muribaculaceae bacterium]|nr:hypothetical protein [Muribaculaceae bacterium]